MKKFILVLFSVFTTASLALAQQEATTTSGRKVLLFDDSTWVYADNDLLYNAKATNISNLEIPQLKPGEHIITHFAYCLSYNETHEQANWIAYELTGDETSGNVERTDKFITDPLVESGTADEKDYSGNGYDRGHLAPAGDMRWSTTAMTESFYYSNMSPQDPDCNRGVWKRCEELVRTWAVENELVYITTGPVLEPGLPAIGSNKVSIPKYYYKVILDYTEPGINAIGFIIPNSGSKEPLQNFAVSIDSVEKLTDIDFFPLLADDRESIIESNVNLKAWTWKSLKSTGSNENQSETKDSSISVQCSGTTKKGTRCKNMTTNPGGRCYLH